MIAKRIFVIYCRALRGRGNRWFCSSDYAPFRNQQIADAFCRELENKFPGYGYKAVPYAPEVMQVEAVR
jgi:hypothetical protein